MLAILEHVLHHPFTTKSNYAREQATLVAAAASEGYLTTKVGEDYSTVWHITPLGLSFLYALKGIPHG